MSFFDILSSLFYFIIKFLHLVKYSIILSFAMIELITRRFWRMSMVHILYIEDESEIGRWVVDVLKERGYDVTWLTSGEGAQAYLKTTDLAILDVMLPGLDGFSLGKRFKNERADLPILMLSARTAVEDKLEGLSFADDYLTKPFHPDELVARIEVLFPYFASLPILALQLWIATTSTNQGFPITIGVLGVIFTYSAYFLPDWMIWRWPSLLNEWNEPLINAMLGIGVGSLLYVVGMVHFARRDVK